MLSSLLSIVAIAFTLKLPSPADAAHNLHNPYKDIVKRTIVNTPASVDGQNFDFVIAGGGVAGLALAARLAEWSNVTVCVIEAGGDGSEFTDQIDIAGYSYLNGLTGTAYDWQYKTTAQIDAGNTVKSWPRGKGLGGSGAINGLFWTKPSMAEFQAWNTLNPDGAEDWGWEEMQKYTSKAETFSPPSAAHVTEFGIAVNESCHGTSGPIQSGYPSYLYTIVENWIPTWVALGFTALDLHSGSTRGVNISPSSIRTSNQTRSDSKAGYIDPFPHSNLVILTGYQVTNINWNSTTSGSAVAGGVSFSAAKGSTVYTVTANKEVILSGGTIGSPQILQLSGVGPSDLITGLNIESVVDLPVGYNLQDHFSTPISFTTPAGTLTWGSLYNATNAATALTEYKAKDYDDSQWTYVNGGIGYPSMADIDSDFANYASTATAALAANVVAMTGYQTLPSTVAAGLTDQYTILNSWLSTDVGQLEIIFNALADTDNVAIQIALQHPYSRGTVMINTTDAFTHPVINPGYLGLTYDVDIINAGIVFARKISNTAPMSTLTLAELTPSVGLTGASLNSFIGTNGSTEYHPLGTCAMLPQAKGGVVDTQLLVYGTTNLRVIDASIIPLHVSSHLMLISYGIAEKGADLIKAQWSAAGLAGPASSTSAAATGVTTATGASVSSAAATRAAAGSSEAIAKATEMSATTKTAVIAGSVGGVGALAAIALLVFCLRRKNNKKQQQTTFYAPNQDDDDAWGGGHHKESYGADAAAGASGLSAMRLDSLGARSTDQLDAPPLAPFTNSRSQSRGSMASMDSAEMYTHQPMETAEGGAQGGWYAPTAASQPYYDNQSPGGSVRSHSSPSQQPYLASGSSYPSFPSPSSQPGELYNSQSQYGNGGH